MDSLILILNDNFVILTKHAIPSKTKVQNTQ